MKYYFKRVLTDSISKNQLYDYETFLVGAVSLMYYFADDTAKLHNETSFVAGLFFALCFIFSGIGIYNHIKNDDSCNLYDVARCILSIVLSIISFFFL